MHTPNVLLYGFDILQECLKILNSLDNSAEVINQLNDCYSSLEEVSFVLSSEISQSEEEVELDSILDRLDNYQKLKRKFNTDTQGLILKKESFEKELNDIHGLRKEHSEISQQLEKMKESLMGLATEIHKKRIIHAKELSKRLTKEIQNLKMEGPMGKNNLPLDMSMFELNIGEGKEVSIKPKIVNPNTKRIWGLNRSLINNAIIGASEGYEKVLELTGVGFRAALKGKQLNLQLGFSHDINFDIPDGIKILVEKQTIIKISGSDKQKVGMIAAEIKSLRPPEPYKGKGIKEQGQYVLRKEGKKK